MKMRETFLKYIQYTKWYSVNTVAKYRKDLKKFEQYLLIIWKTLENPEEIKLVDVIEFIAYLGKIWLVPWSCNAIIGTIRSYLRYCREILELNVIDQKRIHFCKEPERNMEFFNREEKNLIINAVNSWIGKKSITQLRNRLLTYMLLNTWLRCHEIAKIKVEEIWENLQVIGKWGKRRTVFLKKELLDMINEYLSKRKRKSEYLFDSTKEWHMREWSIRNMYLNLTKKVGFRVHAHKFRHTFATDLLNLPWSNIFNVAKLLWHSRITTTQIYLGVNDTELKDLQFRLSL